MAKSPGKSGKSGKKPPPRPLPSGPLPSQPSSSLAGVPAPINPFDPQPPPEPEPGAEVEDEAGSEAVPEPEVEDEVTPEPEFEPYLASYDVEPAPRRPPLMRRLRDRALSRDGALLAAVLVLALLTVGLFRLASQNDDPPAQEARADVPAPPSGMPRTGSYVQSRIESDGTVRVSQWIRGSVPLSSIRVAAADPDGSNDGPRARDVVVAGDGVVVSRRATVSTIGRSFYFSSPSKLVYLSYELTGAVDLSTSSPGRALARLTSLDVEWTPSKGPTEVVILADEVLSVACEATAPTTTEAAPRPCGEPRDGGWGVRLEGFERAQQVSAQVNLG